MAGPQRFLTLAEVAEILNTSMAQVYALVRRGDLVAMRIGGRGQWRVGVDKLEAYIDQAHADAAEHIAQHPFEESEAEIPAD